MCTFDLAGKTALITGASGGIGEAIARLFHAKGAEVILSGRRKEALEKVANDLGEKTHILTCDLANDEDVKSLFDKAADLTENGVDILVCNAGITQDNLSIRMKDEQWNDVINTNLTSTFMLNKAAFKKMMRKKWGRVINITSVVGESGNPGQANYAASKGGTVSMTKSMAVEAAPKGITFNCVAPGFIKTAMTDKLNDNQKEKITSTIPSGNFGLPEDVANTCLFLATDGARYITGQTIHVNGGMLRV